MSAKILPFPTIQRVKEQVRDTWPSLEQRVVDLDRALAFYRAYGQRRDKPDDAPPSAA